MGRKKTVSLFFFIVVFVNFVHFFLNWGKYKNKRYPVVFEELQDEGDGAAVDADEEVDAGQRDVGGAGHAEHVGHGVHHGCHRPPGGGGGGGGGNGEITFKNFEAYLRLCVCSWLAFNSHLFCYAPLRCFNLIILMDFLDLLLFVYCFFYIFSLRFSSLIWAKMMFLNFPSSILLLVCSFMVLTLGQCWAVGERLVVALVWRWFGVSLDLYSAGILYVFIVCVYLYIGEIGEDKLKNN